MFVAEQERKNIALRTGKGRSLKARCGGYSGGRVPYGYGVSDGVLKVNPEEAPIVKTIFDEHDKGTPMLGIAELLDSQGYHTRKGRRFRVLAVIKASRRAQFSHLPFIITQGVFA